jgi:double-strand break repair protein MRE11
MSGLLNYYGRTPESDNIQIKPVLLQKGSTKLALYGMSNVRDERLFRTFRDGNVKFFQPSLHKDEWFNLASVHQNHHAYTESGYLPESFLPEFLDLIIWGHEHECKIVPETNSERGFKVIQPGSSVATSLCQPETEPKHVTILSITGKEFTHEPIRLKSVRPFVMKEIVLQDDARMKKIGLKGGDNKVEVDRYCMRIVEELIEQANEEWLELQRDGDGEIDEQLVPPLPLIRLRCEYTAPEGGLFMIDNPQRFSARYAGRVANTNDIIQYHRKKTAGVRKPKQALELPDAATMAQHMDAIKIDELVSDFLTAQSLTILPQGLFGDAVQQFVQKDDKHAMEDFIKETMGNQVEHLVKNDGNMDDENAMAEMMEQLKNKFDQNFENGDRTNRKRTNRKPKPDDWDTDMDGAWDDNPASVIRNDLDEDGMEVDGEDDDGDGTPAPRTTAARGRGSRARGRGGRTTAAGTTRKTAAAAMKAPAKAPAKSRKKKAATPSDEEEEEENEVIMLDDDDDDDVQEGTGLFVSQDTQPAPKRAPARKAAAKKATPATTARQTQLSFTNSQAPAAASGSRSRATGARAAAPKRLQEPVDDEISDDDDAFETPPASMSTRRR